MNKNKLSAKIKYSFDNLMSKGAFPMIVMLAVVSAVFIFFFAGIVMLVGAAPEESGGNYFEVAWMSLMRTLDSGTMGGDSGTFGIIMLGVTLVGVFMVSALIGIINNGLEDKLDSLRKGRSRVIESGHTVILGWSDQIFTIISEIIAANENQKKGCIVIMGDKDKVEMEEEIKDKIGKSGKTKIVCRSGNPIDMNDLAIVNLDNAHSIIIISGDGDDSDADVIKTMLAITNNPSRKSEPYHIVAEIRSPKNMDVAKIVGKDEVELVLVGDLISRIIAQTCRQSGLSVVYTELLDVEGDEIYFTDADKFQGKKYSEVLNIFEDSTVIGIAEKGKNAVLNPAMDRVINKDDKLIVISQDDSTIKVSENNNPQIDKNTIVTGFDIKNNPEKTLILGWNWRATTIINELDNYVAPGSSVTVVAENENGNEEIEKKCIGNIKNMTIKFIQDDTTDRTLLDSLSIFDYNHIIILCYSDDLEIQQSDAKTLITLLHLRDMSEKTGKPLSIVSEMMDIKNRDLAQVAKVNDFIVSDKLISLMLSQISENKYLNSVFTDMFDPEGSEVYLKPFERYVKENTEVNFYTVVEAGKGYGETVIGYKIEKDAYNSDNAYGVKVNPVKSEKVKFSKGDKIIVMAES